MLVTRLLIRCSKAIINVQKRSYRPKRSFLSNKEGVRDFIALLDEKEQSLLYEELSELRNVPSMSSIQPPDDRPPSFAQLRLVCLNQAIPFLGFGFLDNVIMIVAGDYIDTTIGLTLGISTMAAAGLGNALSDIAGIGSAWYVERIATKIGITTPKLSIVQSKMPRTRWSVHIGRAIGVAVGCLIGMFPLLFLPTKEVIEKKNLTKQEK